MRVAAAACPGAGFLASGRKALASTSLAKTGANSGARPVFEAAEHFGTSLLVALRAERESLAAESAHGPNTALEQHQQSAPAAQRAPASRTKTEKAPN